MKRLGEILLSLNWMLVQHRVTFSIYTYRRREILRLKCLAREHNTVTPPRAWTRTVQSEVQHTSLPLGNCASHIFAVIYFSECGILYYSLHALVPILHKLQLSYNFVFRRILDGDNDGHSYLFILQVQHQLLKQCNKTGDGKFFFSS